MDTLAELSSLAAFAVVGAVVAVGARVAWTRHRRARRRQTDPLTQLPTRQAFEQRARQALAERSGDPHPAALLMLDLDRFKKINERHGRAVGDRVLAHFAGILRRATGPSDLLARSAGEEFCLLISRDGAGDTLQVAQDLCAAVRQTPFAGAGEPITLSVSIGVAHFAAGGNLDTMLARADRYLYLAKSRGGDQALDREPRLRSRAWSGNPPTASAPDTPWSVATGR